MSIFRQRFNGKVRELLANIYYELLQQICMLDVYKKCIVYFKMLNSKTVLTLIFKTSLNEFL